ncbi:hypothetical protein PHJA_002972300 [Phtheirospermum japonicum]|uniref:DUF641 domain-containing protein n=1 Tax=Phtheirospermum japonicum TaxID=374723 RepID=A0A830DC48_9LAMI|nr:hypothetical protein PHJA_002972300 [Phtheirospermum japonicum]
MDSVKRSSVTPTKSRLARTFAKVLHIQSVKSHEKTKKDQTKRAENIPSYEDEEDEKLKDRAVKEAFLAKLFASISTVKAAYAQMQFAQSPYDADGIQSSDNAIVSELKNLSELKQCYLKKELNETSPEKTLVLSEIQEHKSLLKTYEVTGKKLDFQLKLKESEITFLKEKLAEANSDIKSLEKKLNSSGQISVPVDVLLSDLKLTHFITYFRQVIKSIRSFVRLFISEMQSAGWNLDSAASSIEPGISFWKPRKNRGLFFAMFKEMRSVGATDYLSWKPKSPFTSFCREKYLKLVHPKMEASIFGNLDQRGLVSSGDIPETGFFSAFCEMAKRVWLLHCLALSYDPEVTVFQVSKGSRFSEVYMDSLSDEAFVLCDDNSETYPRVAFTVVPGFRIGKTVVQCQVYLY